MKNEITGPKQELAVGQAGRQTGRQAARQAGRRASRQADKGAGRQAGRQTGKQASKSAAGDIASSNTKKAKRIYNTAYVEAVGVNQSPPWAKSSF